MILQALTQLYYDLLERGEIAAPGWNSTDISFALCLNLDGEVTQIVPTMREVQVTEKRTVLKPQSKILPAPVKRTTNTAANFLWDNSGYLLGLDKNRNLERGKVCFATSAQLHHSILDSVDTPTAKAILSFFDTWQPENAETHPALSEQVGALTKGGNLIFRVNGKFAQDDSEIKMAWQKYYNGDADNIANGQCLITGEPDEIEAVHPTVKGVFGSNPSGAALVSFNAWAFCSYGHTKSYNAPIGKRAAFAYTSALNYLLANEDTTKRIGDTTVLCWAVGAEPQYQRTALNVLEGTIDDDVRSAIERLANFEPCDELDLDPNRPFYILGIAPNNARLAVRFFMKDSFGNFMKNVNDHNKRLEINGARFNSLPLWALLNETANQNSKIKVYDSGMAAAVARAIFMGTPYPASLISNVMLRIRAEHDVPWSKAAIIKAYYLKNQSDFPKEVLTVGLNENSTDVAYNLGRLFSVYEATQRAAINNITTTIKDRFFSSAATMPANIFPVLARLYQKHLRKLEIGRKIYFDNQVTEIKSVLGENYPARLSLTEQGAFDLGYYHQKANYFKSNKEEKENG